MFSEDPSGHNVESGLVGTRKEKQEETLSFGKVRRGADPLNCHNLVG